MLGPLQAGVSYLGMSTWMSKLPIMAALRPKAKGIWAMILGTLAVQVSKVRAWRVARTCVALLSACCLCMVEPGRQVKG